MTVLDERPTYYQGVTKAVSDRLEDHYTDHIGDPELGRKAAQVILDNAHDPHYRMALIFALDEFVSNMIDQHRVELQAMLDAADRKAKSQVRKALVAKYLDDRVHEEISKINAQDNWDEDEHPRGAGGRFKDKMLWGYVPNPLDVKERPFRGNAGQTLGEPLNRDQAADFNRYLSAYAQFIGMPEGRRQRAVFTIQDKDGNLRDSNPTHNMPPMSADERIIHVRPIGYEFPHELGGQVFNISQSLGMDSDRAGSAGAAAHNFNQAVQQTGWGKRLAAATQALYYATGNGDNPTKELAAQVAHMVGTHGPEATKVLAPNMRRAAYRYRGVEAGPESLDENIQGLPKVTANPNGTVNVQSIQGVENQLANNLHAQLPDDQTVQTLLKAGSMPPSRGYIIDKTGKPVILATGAMDDHYVPFNLRNMGKLNKGSYVRTRAYGGPTTEDFQVALASGARSFVIESKQGTYRVDLAERAGTKPAKVATRLPGKAGELYSHLPGNRFGDANTKLVVKRYGRLLDALKHGKITATDPKTGEKTLKLDAEGYEVALKALQAQFPYLIKNVEFKPVSAQGQTAEGHRAGQAFEDIGYVRPFYLKPSGAAGTYWDPLIEPTGRRGISFDDMETYRYGVARRNRRGEGTARPQQAAATPTGAYPRVVRDREGPDYRPLYQQYGATGTIAPNVPKSAAPEVHAAATPEGMGERIEIRPQGERDLRDEITEDEMDDWEQWLTAAKQRLRGLPEAEGPDADEDLKDFMESFHPTAAEGTDRYKEHMSWRDQYQHNASQRDELERLIDGAMGAHGITGLESPPRFEVMTPEEQRDAVREAEADQALPPPNPRAGSKWTKSSWEGSNAQTMLSHARMFGVYQGHKDRMANGTATPGQINWVENFYEKPPKPGSKAHKLFGNRSPADWWQNADGAMTPIGPAVIENPDGSQTAVSPAEFYLAHQEPSLGDRTLFDHYSDVDNVLRGGAPRYEETLDHVSADDPDARAAQALRELESPERRRLNEQDYE